MKKTISFDFLATTIIKIKNSVFGKNYITLDEFYYIEAELQKEFNKVDRNVIIYSDFGKFDPDVIKLDNGIITIAPEPLTKYVLTSTSVLADYAYIILELIMEYTKIDFENQKSKLDNFNSENVTFEEKQKCLGILLGK